MSHVVSNDGTSIAYETSGSDSTVILVDGAMGYRNHNGTRPLAAVLAHDCTVVSYDRRGRGESADTQPYAVEREIDDIDRLIEEIGGPACIYGFSSGAVLALRAGSALGPARVAALVLHEPSIDPDPGSAAEIDRDAETLANLVAEGRRGDAVSFFLSDMIPPQVLEQLRQAPDWEPKERVAHTLVYDYAVMGGNTLLASTAATATMSSLVLVGSESEAFKREGAWALAEAMPRATLRVLDGEMTLVAPEVLAPVVREFVHARLAAT
jgi:pimeloyl-ACP methyl ester carboxylesterase